MSCQWLLREEYGMSVRGKMTDESREAFVVDAGLYLASAQDALCDLDIHSLLKLYIANALFPFLYR